MTIILDNRIKSLMGSRILFTILRGSDTFLVQLLKNILQKDIKYDARNQTWVNKVAHLLMTTSSILVASPGQPPNIFAHCF